MLGPDADLDVLLARIDPRKPESAEPAAREILEQAREGPAGAVEQWLDPQRRLRERAAELLKRLEELPLAPVESAETSIYDRLTAVGWLGAALNRLHDLAIRRIEAALGDRRVVPLPEGSHREEEPDPETRVRDVAYLQLRAVQHLAESPLTAEITATEFLHHPAEEKDSEAGRRLRREPWREFVDDVGEDRE
jgi:hypothetical protein